MASKYDGWLRSDLARMWHQVGGNPHGMRQSELVRALSAYDTLATVEERTAFVAAYGKAEDMPETPGTAIDARAHAEQIIEETQPPAHVAERDIATLLATAAAEMHSVAKSGRNDQFHYNYRTYDDIVNAVRGPLTKHGVAMTFKIVDRQMEIRTTRGGGQQFHVILTVDFTFTGPPMERLAAPNSLSVTTIGEGMDNLDKATNKALVAATKYMLTTVFLIASGDDTDDADAGGQAETARPPAEGFASLEDEAHANRHARRLVGALPEADREEIFEYVRDQGFTRVQPWPSVLCERVSEIAARRTQTVDEPVDDELSRLGEEPFA